METKMSMQKVSLDFQYFIRVTIQKKMAWSTLSFLLTDLAVTPEKSKQVIKILVKELENWVSKKESGQNNVIEGMNDEVMEKEKQMDDIVQDDQIVYDKLEKPVENFEENSFDFNEDDTEVDSDSLDDDIELYNEDFEGKNKDLENENESETGSPESQNNKTIVDFDTTQFYEFIGNTKKSSSNESNIELSKGETNVNDEIEEQCQRSLENEIDISDINEKKIKKNECKFCEKDFATKQRKETHERVHTGEKPFHCTFCQKAFTLEHHLKRHDRIHTGEKPFQCNTCTRYFNDTGSLKRHERIHTGEKPYQCKYCKTSFTHSKTLKNHEKIHSGERPYQ